MITTKASKLPAFVQWPVDSFNNLLEQPTQFYAAVLALTLLDVKDTLTTRLAWGYVGLRVVHSLIHVSVNKVTPVSPSGRPAQWCFLVSQRDSLPSSGFSSMFVWFISTRPHGHGNLSLTPAAAACRAKRTFSMRSLCFLAILYCEFEWCASFGTSTYQTSPEADQKLWAIQSSGYIRVPEYRG